MKYHIYFPIYLIYECDKNIANLIYSIIIKKNIYILYYFYIIIIIIIIFYIIILEEISDKDIIERFNIFKIIIIFHLISSIHATFYLYLNLGLKVIII